MLKLFKHRPSVSQIIAQIHNEFDSATEKLLNEAKVILGQQCDLSKGSRLSALGFDSAKSVTESKEISRIREENRQLAQSVKYFSQWYPNNKFITEKMAKGICEKYGLVFGDAFYYKGDVPDKNITEMEAFKLRDEDMIKTSGYDRYIRERAMRQFRLGGDNLDIESLHKEVHLSKAPFKICAPEKDFDTRYLVKKGYKFEYDPIVLQPVQGGFLVVTKWGLEGSDELVVNNKMN